MAARCDDAALDWPLRYHLEQDFITVNVDLVVKCDAQRQLNCLSRNF